MSDSLQHSGSMKKKRNFKYNHDDVNNSAD